MGQRATTTELDRNDAVRMAAQALALLQAGHSGASVGVYRAMALRFPALGAFCEVQIQAVELLRVSAA